MAAKRPPARPRAPRRAAAARPDSVSARKVSEWVGLITGIAALVGFGVDQLYSHWKRGEEAQQTATALTLYKTETDKNIAAIRSEADTKVTTARSELSDRLTKVETHADTIDKTGTDYGRSQYSTQSVERAQMKKDVADLQDTLRTLAPALEEVKIDVRWIKANLGAPDAVTAAQMPRLRPRALHTRERVER